MSSRLQLLLLGSLVIAGCSSPAPNEETAPTPPAAPTTQAQPPSTATGPVAVAPSAGAIYKRVKGKVELELTVENTADVALKNMKVTAFTLDKVPCKGFPYTVGDLAPKSKFTHKFDLGTLRPGKNEQSISLTFLQEGSSTESSAQMGDTVQIP